MNPTDVGSGIVNGGQTFVWASYALSWVLLVGYTVSLRLRMNAGETK